MVVYFTRTGNTKIVAEKIAKKLDSDIEEILDNKKRTGFIGLTGAVINPRGLTSIKEIIRYPKDYDIVIIGTPIWWYTCAPAVTEYLKKYGEEIKRGAFFFTCKVDNKITALSGMETHLGKSPVGTIGIESPTIKNNTFDKKVESFIRDLKRNMKFGKDPVFKK